MTSSIGVRRAALAATLVVAGLVGTGCSHSSGQAVPGGSSGTAAATSGPRTVSLPRGTGVASASRSTLPSWAKSALEAFPPPQVGTTNRVAQAAVPAVAVYRSRDDAKPFVTLKNPTASKVPLVFLVQEQGTDRVRVLLPLRPNGSQGWVKARDVKVLQHDYRIVVSVGQHTLTVYKGQSVVMKERAGLGTSTTPTPGGVFYTKELIKPPTPNGAYGPYAYGLSGYSQVLDEFLGGQGEIGIHGTNDPAGLGKNVSHGCIRISNEAITKLATMLPLGVPVQIVR
jgi:lipoprotein-anchoring transpeptidase ErfK/SrfK